MARSYKKSNQTSNHSLRRSKQRAGASRNQAKIQAHRAFCYGLLLNQTTGELYDLMKTYVGVVRYYANAFYIFSGNDILITMFPVDPKFEENLFEYTDYNSFVTYINNRYQFTTNKSKRDLRLRDGRRYIRQSITSFFDPVKVKIQCIEKKNCESTVFIKAHTNSITPEKHIDFVTTFHMYLAVQYTEEE